jgi:hypothetical protein
MQKDIPFIEIRDTIMGAAITYLLLKLEGVDTEPDILDESKKGPWVTFVTELCSHLFSTKYGDTISLTICDKNITFSILYEDLTPKKTGISNHKANARAMASALTDISTHIVIRVYHKAICNRVGLNRFKQGLLKAGLRMITANRERRKIDTASGLLSTGGKKFIWHVYVLPITGPTYGFHWPKKILIDIDGDFFPIDYAIRASLELGGKDDNLCLHYGLRHCKGYNAVEGKTLLEKKFKIRLCECDQNKEQAYARKARRVEHKAIDFRAALQAPSPKDCSRFLNGICLLNKKGKKCSSNHNIKDAWDTSPEGEICCTIECGLKPHSMLQGYCLLGKECLYKYTKKCAAIYTFIPSPAHLHAPLLVSPQVGVVRHSSQRDPKIDHGSISLPSTSTIVHTPHGGQVPFIGVSRFRKPSALLRRKGLPKASARGCAAAGRYNFKQHLKLEHQRRTWGLPRPLRKVGHLT